VQAFEQSIEIGVREHFEHALFDDDLICQVEGGARLYAQAGAGIVVRNSIILVDFIELRLKEGMPLDQAMIDAGAVRFRPMMLIAAAVIVCSAVILSDPLFQGLAIALIAGEIASPTLSRMTVPVLYFIVNRRGS